MNKALLAAALLAASASAPVALAADVGVSISVGQPGFYGRIDIGDAPRPQLIYEQPVVIQPAPVAYPRQPIYLRVPPGHEKNWGRYCGRYAACGQPVYFVRDTWYRDVYVPHYHPRPAVRPVVVRPAVVVRPPVVVHAPPRREDRHDDRHNDRHDDRGRGNGHGNGNAYGHDKDKGKDRRND